VLADPIIATRMRAHEIFAHFFRSGMDQPAHVVVIIWADN
jgi:hypothetical protein